MTIMECLHHVGFNARNRREKHVLFQGKLAQINLVFRRGDKVQKLAHLGLIGCIMEELYEFDVVRLFLEVFLQEPVNTRLEHEGIVNGDHANLSELVGSIGWGLGLEAG